MDLCTVLPSRPLQRAVELKRLSLGMSLEQFGSFLGVTSRTLHRLMSSKWIGVYPADHLAIRLGLHPALLWGLEWTALTPTKPDRKEQQMEEKLPHTKRLSDLAARRKRNEDEGSWTEGRLLTVNDVSDLLQVAQTFVYRHAREIGAIKVGSHLRFRREDLEAWLRTQPR